MYVVIVGGGRVGYYLAKTLMEQGHRVVVIDKDKARCMALQNELGEIVVWGSGSNRKVLQEAGCDRADAVVIATREDDDNLVVSQVVAKEFNVQKVIARINNPANGRIFRQMGITNIVSSINIIAELLETEAVVKETSQVIYRSKDLHINSIRITVKSEAVNRSIKELPIPQGYLITAVIRDKGVFVPNGDTVLEIGDQILVLSTQTESNEDLAVFGEAK